MPPEIPLADDDATTRAHAAAYRDYLVERDEILRHKWILSERAGQDVGFETALIAWVTDARATWRRQRSRKAEA
jgi:hypothetical protein